jgi:hypothetical protein
MELPLAFFRMQRRLDLFSIPDEYISGITRRSCLALAGRRHPARLGRHLPATLIWNSTHLSGEENAREERAFLELLRTTAPDRRLVVKVDGTSQGKGVEVLLGGDASGPQLCRAPKYRKASCVGQRYVENPCLLPPLPPLPPPGAAADVAKAPVPVAGYKWDARIYLLVVLNGDPQAAQRVWAFEYHAGFARRCRAGYSADGKNRDAHITNTAANNKSGDRALLRYARALAARLDAEGASEAERAKYPTLVGELDDYAEFFQQLDLEEANGEAAAIAERDRALPVTMVLERAWQLLEQVHGADRVARAQADTRQLMRDLVDSVMHPSLGMLQPNEARSPLEDAAPRPLQYKKHVLLAGLDVLFDHDLKPWLLEVNRFPDMTCYSIEQLAIKQDLIRDAVLCAFPRSEKHIEQMFHHETTAEQMDVLWSTVLNPPVEELSAEDALNWAVRPGSRWRPLLEVR